MLPLPSVERVRLATLEDLHRISIVAAAAFFWSPTFRFQRPRYNDFPLDTIASYLVEYKAAIKDPACAVLVAEDVLEEDEAKDVYEALRFAYGPKSPRQKGIVGVCSLSLKPNSYYIGHCQPGSKLLGAACSETDMTSNTEAAHLGLAWQDEVRNLKRDQCAAALEVYNMITGTAKLEHLAGKMRLSTLAVAPSYWRRGHASRLVSFCTQLADLDDAVLGVSATPKGQIIVEKAGFKQREITHVTRLVAHEQQACQGSSDAAEVTLWIGVRLPGGRSPSSSIGSWSGSPTDSQ
ncbi:Nn.00g092300.m01.CDS01 [Neocucurbitaria sp. VM-36]